MDPRILLFCIIGAALFLSVWMERRLEGKPFGLPLVLVGAGYLLFSLPLGLPEISPLLDEAAARNAEYLTEFIVIASLMGAGIAIDRPLSWPNWKQIWPLLAILMPLTIAAVAFLGWWGLGLAPASAILLGAALAPTDPVLARSVQVGPPGLDDRHDVRFGLTVEAGINDGLAFPFTYLALAAIGVMGIGSWTWDWFAVDFVWRIVAGVTVGGLLGWGGARWVHRHTEEVEVSHHEKSEGLIVLGVLLAAYGFAEVVHGYGFLAVFAAAVAARQVERRNEYHKLSHHFIDQIERIVLVAMLLGFGALLASGILRSLTWGGAALGLGLLFVIRPLFGMLSQTFCNLPWSGRLAVSFLGIRGMGTLYYLAFAMNHDDFAGMDQLWSIACFTILTSIIVHGATAAPILKWAEARNGHVLRGQGHAIKEEAVAEG